jgi:hypothetical protein
LQGPAILTLVPGVGLPETKLVGAYANGSRVGLWTQYDPVTGAKLGSFTLDEMGSGVEEIRDQAGHMKRGAVLRGKREGTWTYFDSRGKVTATEVWSNDKMLRSSGTIPWAGCGACPEEPVSGGDPEDLDDYPKPSSPSR